MDNVLRFIIAAIITFILGWVILSLLLQWANPALYDGNGNVNWWTTLWVALVTIIILWIVLLILHFITEAFSKKGAANDACNPCNQQAVDLQGRPVFDAQGRPVTQQQMLLMQQQQQFAPQTLQTFAQ